MLFMLVVVQFFFYDFCYALYRYLFEHSMLTLFCKPFFLQIWLTDIVANLQHKLKNVPQKDPVFEGKPQGSLTGKYTVLQLWLVVLWMGHSKTLTIFFCFREKNAVQIQEISPILLSKLLIILQNFVYSSVNEVVSRKRVLMMQCVGQSLRACGRLFQPQLLWNEHDPWLLSQETKRNRSRRYSQPLNSPPTHYIIQKL